MYIYFDWHPLIIRYKVCLPSSSTGNALNQMGASFRSNPKRVEPGSTHDKNWKKKTLERWWKCPITHIWGRYITSSKCFHDSPVGFCTPHNIWLPSELHFPCRPFQSSTHFSKPVHSFKPFHSSQWWIIFLLHKILAWTFFFFLTLPSFFFVFSNPVRKNFFKVEKTPVVHKVYSQTY